MIRISRPHLAACAATLALAAALSPTAARADATPECNAGPLPGSTECGTGSDASLGTQNTAQLFTSGVVPPVFGALIAAAGYPLAFAVCAVLPLIAVPLVPVAGDPLRSRS